MPMPIRLQQRQASQKMARAMQRVAAEATVVRPEAPTSQMEPAQQITTEAFLIRQREFHLPRTTAIQRIRIRRPVQEAAQIRLPRRRQRL